MGRFCPAAVNGLRYRFAFRDTGSSGANSHLRLTGGEPFLHPFNALNTIELLLDREEIKEGDRFRGGFFTDLPSDFLPRIHGATVQVYVADQNGLIEREGRSYRPYDLDWAVTLAAVPENLPVGDETVPGRILEVRIGDLTGFLGWSERNFSSLEDRSNPQVSGPSADPLGDGVPNLLRYALGLDLAVPDRAELPAAELEGDRLSLRFPRDPAKRDIAYVVEASSDLRVWSEVLYDSRIDQRDNTDGQWMRVTDEAGPEEGRRFLRLRVFLVEDR
jgi:hypothetical protein